MASAAAFSFWHSGRSFQGQFWKSECAYHLLVLSSTHCTHHVPPPLLPVRCVSVQERRKMTVRWLVLLSTV